MKKILNILLVIVTSIFICSCYFKDDTVLPKTDISELELVTPYDELTFKAMEKPNFSVEVNQSGEKRELSFEWAYGDFDENGAYPMHNCTVISNDSILNYQFPYLDTYSLRLIVTNGEDVQVKFFKLTVSAGYDEGLAILTRDDSNMGHLSFLKTLNEQEIAAGVEQKMITEFYEDLPINNPQDITSPKNQAIFITDGDGRILVFNQRTMALDMIVRPEQLAGGSYITNFVGYFSNPTQGKLGCFCWTNDKKIYRFNSNVGELGTYKTNKYAIFDLEDVDAEIVYEMEYNKYIYLTNYTKSTITGIDGSYGYFHDYSDEYELITVGYPYMASSSYLYVMASLKSDPTKYVVMKEYKRLDRQTVIDTYTLPEERTINKDTKFIVSDEYDDYLYYTYNNRLYRWEFGSKGMPNVENYVRLDIPEGEEIVDMCFNGDKEGDIIYISTYNPSRASDLKGSIYVYHADTFERLNAFEGVTHRTVNMIYKEI